MLYNLVETIKEADVEKLSFVAQLSQEFWRRSQAPPAHSAGGGATKSVSSKSRGSHRPLRGSEWMPPSLLWLVQRDFLQGSTVDEYLRAALKVTDTAAADEHAKRLNQIRKALTAFGDGMSGLGLVQPHVKRTSLCDLQAEALAPEYTAGLARVREWVRVHTLNDGAGGPIALKKSRHPFRTRAGGRLWASGSELVAQLHKLVDALNSQDIPTAGSVIDAFNREVVLRNIDELKTALKVIVLPLSIEDLDSQAAANQRAQIGRQTFGADLEGSDGLATFDSSVAELLKTLADANFRASHSACNVQWEMCSTAVDNLKSSTLPSRRRFWARIQATSAHVLGCMHTPCS
ncbi:MAG: hypothetical protein SGPRY_013347 [Prymnesium sp.]